MKVSASDTPLPNIDNSSSGKHSPMLPLLIVSPASQRARNRIQPHLDAVQMDLWISLTESWLYAKQATKTSTANALIQHLCIHVATSTPSTPPIVIRTHTNIDAASYIQQINRANIFSCTMYFYEQRHRDREISMEKNGCGAKRMFTGFGVYRRYKRKESGRR